MTPPMNRREAVRATAVVVGGLLLTPNGLVLASRSDAEQQKSRVLTAADQALIEEIADTLLPTTRSSPGARAARAGPEINLLLTDCYEPDAQVRVVNGLKELRRVCDARFHRSFTQLPAPTREAFLRDIDAEATRAGSAHWFGLVRELAERAYFSSEIGMTKARRWVLVPGRWVGCVPLEPGQPAWG
jgi:Gluconate 2-dehydrogenase subunit 3